MLAFRAAAELGFLVSTLGLGVLLPTILLLIWPVSRSTHIGLKTLRILLAVLALPVGLIGGTVAWVKDASPGRL